MEACSQEITGWLTDILHGGFWVSYAFGDSGIVCLLPLLGKGRDVCLLFGVHRILPHVADSSRILLCPQAENITKWAFTVC